jgi:hypothetical protein
MTIAAMMIALRRLSIIGNAKNPQVHAQTAPMK